MRCYLYPVKILITKKKKKEEEANVGKEVEKRECSCTVDENVKLV